MRARRLVPGVLLVVLAFAATGALASGTESTLTLDANTTFQDSDTYVLSIDVTEEIVVEGESWLTVEGSYTGDDVERTPTIGRSNANPSIFGEGELGFDLSKRHAGTFVSIHETTGSGPNYACGTCRAQMIGVSINDWFALGEGSTWDVTQVEAAARGPTSLEAETDQESTGWNGFYVEISWRADEAVSPGTYELVVTIPDAQHVKVIPHLHLREPANVTLQEDAHGGGFLFAGDDFQPTARVNTAPVGAMVEGEASVTVPQGERIWGAMSPAWYGKSQFTVNTLLCRCAYAPTHSTAAVGNYGIEHPDGSVSQATYVTAFSPNGPALFDEPPGEYRFFVDYQAGVGPQDLYAVGFVEP